jgi:hypothetical protein
MKQETNKEMDLLLRRLSRRQDGAMPDADPQIIGEHLDADELSSYAENALPAAARARYTEHLAECTGCRELVVQLSSSLGVVVAEQPSKTPEPSGLRNFLASLFSPMVLRYAVPALGLIVVAAIGLLFFNSGLRSSPEVAVQRNQTPLAGDVPPQSSSTPAQGLVNQVESSPKQSSRHSVKPDPNAPAPLPNTPPSATINMEVKKEAPATKAEEQPAAADTAAAQPPKPHPTVDQFRVEAEGRKPVSAPQVAGAAKVATEKPSEQKKGEDRRADDEAASRSDPAKNTAPPAATVGSGRLRAGIMRDGVEEKDKADAETRSVGGRRFRKARGIWIDTSYESGTGTTTLTRGSEQYRALVADEPTIKTIAEQLDGEVIVVWKGRAYRIR